MGMNSVMTKTRLTWLGHGSWLIEADANDEQGSTRIVFD
jgi:hypothetical protein